MQSHRGTQTHLINSEDDEEDNQGLIAFLKERMHSASPSQEEGRERGGDEEEERMEEEVEEEEEKEDEDEHEHEVGVYSNPSLAWSFRDHEASDDFDRVASTSSQPYQAQSYGDSRRNSSSSHHNSIVSSKLPFSITFYVPSQIHVSLIKHKTVVLTGNGAHI